MKKFIHKLEESKKTKVAYKKTYQERVKESFVGMVIGFIFFVGSFILLYWNEGRVDLSIIAKTATEITSDVLNTDPTLSGKLVSLRGIVSSDQLIGDNLFLEFDLFEPNKKIAVLKPDRYLALERKVEMYAWIEEVTTEHKIEEGGSETIKKTYTYHKKWTENPPSSLGFKNPVYVNPPKKAIENYTNKVTRATIGVYNFDPQTVTLPSFSRLSLNKENIILKTEKAILIDDVYLYIPKGVGGIFSHPGIGDLRVSYNVLYSDFEGTLFGKLNENKIDPYLDQAGNQLYRIFTEPRESAIITLHKEYVMAMWIFRFIGFLIMWGALVVIFAPISVILDVTPTIGALSRRIISKRTFIVTLALTIITVLVLIISRNLIVLSVIVSISTAGTLVAFFYLLKNKEKYNKYLERCLSYKTQTQSLLDIEPNTEPGIRSDIEPGIEQDNIKQDIK